MSIEGINRETCQEGNRQGKGDGNADFLRKVLEQKGAGEPITDIYGYSSKVWGLKHLQDMKGEPAEIAGAFDPKLELWITKEPIKGLEPSDETTIRNTSYHTDRPRSTGGGKDRLSEVDENQDRETD